MKLLYGDRIRGEAGLTKNLRRPFTALRNYLATIPSVRHAVDTIENTHRTVSDAFYDTLHQITHATSQLYEQSR